MKPAREMQIISRKNCVMWNGAFFQRKTVLFKQRVKLRMEKAGDAAGCSAVSPVGKASSNFKLDCIQPWP